VAASDDLAYFQQLDTQLTAVVRLARNPRLTERMGAGTAGDSRLYLLLNLLNDRGPTRAADLLESVAVDQSTLSRQLAALVERGLVQRETDPTDGRAARIVVTPLGKKTIGSARAAWQETLAALMAGWSADDRVALLRLLGKLSADLAPVVYQTDPEG
jgi:DNA-binding MarR family transcriptional regulator